VAVCEKITLQPGDIHSSGNIREAVGLPLTARFLRLLTLIHGQVGDATGMDFSAGALAVARGQSPGGNSIYRHLSVFPFDDVGAYDLISFGECLASRGTSYSLQ
jgi:hypothetical protein